MNGNIVIQGNFVFLKANNGNWYYFDPHSSLIGAGAMGQVFLGYSRPSHSGGYAMPVAIKQIREKYANIPSVRFRAKQESLLTFRHPNMIEILGYCENDSQTGPFFMISKYVKGENIDIFIRKSFVNFQGIVKARHICEMIYPIMDVLDFLHGQGIVHMDIKPSNIMVENGRNVRLMDLGIAHTEHFQSLNSNSSSSLMGTPQYAAPEQFGVLSDKQNIDATTDVYELGITLYELLTGVNPLSSRTLSESVAKHQNLILPYFKDVPNELILVLRKATNRDKKFRFFSMSEFKSAVQQSLTEKNKPWWKKIF